MNNMIPLLPFDPEQNGPVNALYAYVACLRDGRLFARYEVWADVERLKLPARAVPARTDGLWQSTCFELFLREEGVEPYFEYNFAPSGHWAAYSFSKIRTAMAALDVTAIPDILVTQTALCLRIDVHVNMPLLRQHASLVANLSAVIETTDGQHSYWAAKHPDKNADFHDPGCFVVPIKAGDPL
jgi:hypothetical protein